MGNKFEIVEYAKDDDSYMYSDTDYYWHVASVQTGDELASYSGYHNESSAGVQKGGARSVGFNEDMTEVIISNYDKEAERLELPENVELVDEGHAILLTYRDGRQDKRNRRAVCYTTKFGEPIFRKLIGDPAHKNKKKSK